MRATRLAVLSDLHLGGEPPYMMSRPELLAGLLDRLPSERAPDEDLEVVVAGDFVDFLAQPPWRPFTADPVEAAGKLSRVLSGAPFGGIFDALGRLLAAGHRLTVLIGNHDLEMALPPVQDALLRRLGDSGRRVRFVNDERAYVRGQALVEHGNRYDRVNANDWCGLAALASALSRHEAIEDPVRPSAGSAVVARFINPLKRRYPFVDLLKPNGELVPLLLAAFEPTLLLQMERLAWLMRDELLHRRNPKGSRRAVHQPLEEPDPQLAAAFGRPYDRLQRPKSRVATLSWLEVIAEPHRDGLAALFDRGEPIPPRRLEQIRLLLLRLLFDDASSRPEGPTEAWGEAARRMLEDSRGSLSTVVMGHTHQARQVGPPDRAFYINTGTWADVIRVPREALAPGEGERLTAFLRDLYEDRRTPWPATWADLRIEANGAVSHARLRSEGQGPGRPEASS